MDDTRRLIHECTRGLESLKANLAKTKAESAKSAATPARFGELHDQIGSLEKEISKESARLESLRALHAEQDRQALPAARSEFVKKLNTLANFSSGHNQFRAAARAAERTAVDRERICSWMCEYTQHWDSAIRRLNEAARKCPTAAAANKAAGAMEELLELMSQKPLDLTLLEAYLEASHEQHTAYYERELGFATGDRVGVAATHSANQLAAVKEHLSSVMAKVMAVEDILK